MAAYKAVLFDFDGVLAKSVDDHARAWVRAVADLGGTITVDDWYPLEGTKTIEIAKILWAKGGVKGECEPEKLFGLKEKYYKQDHYFAFYPGAQGTIAALKERGIPRAIVTSSVRSNLDATVPADFLSLFNAIVTGDMLQRGKPFPDPYLRGAADLGFKAEECVVVENAPLGVASAKAAGAYCVAVLSTADRAVLAAADEFIGRIGDLVALPVVQEIV